MGFRISSLAQRMWEAQDRLCSICDAEMYQFELEHPSRGWTVDHVWPRGGRWHYQERGNILLAHAECNETKACRAPTSKEIAVLSRVNELLGWEMIKLGRRTGKSFSKQRDVSGWSDGVTGPSALALALQDVVAA